MTAVLVAAIAAIVAAGTFPIGPLRLIDLAQIGLILAGAVALLRRRAVATAWTPLLWPAALLVAWTALSWSTAEGSRIVWVIQASLGLGSAAVISGLVLHEQHLRFALAGILAAGALATVLGLIGTDALTARSGADVVSGRPTGPFTQPNQLGTALAVSAIVGLALSATNALAGRTRAMVIAATLLTFSGLALTLSRGAWLATVAGVVALIVLHPGVRRAAPAVVLVVGAAGATGLVAVAGSDGLRVFTERAGSIIEGTDDAPQDRREEIWAQAVEQVRADALLGSGPGRFEDEAGRSGGERAEHAHNLVLQTAVDAGIPAVAALAAVAIGVFAATRSARRRATWAGAHDTAALVVVPGVALAVISAHGLIDHSLTHPTLAALPWALVGLAAAAPRVVSSALDAGSRGSH